MEDQESRIVELLQIVDELQEQIEALREQQTIAQETLQAINRGEIDAVVVSTDRGEQIFTLQGVDYVYRLFVEQMGGGAVTVSLEGFILYSNQKFAKLLGYPLENVIGSRLKNFVVPQDLGKFQTLLQQSQKQIGISEEISLISSEGNEITTQLSLTKLDIGNILIYCIIITDLTAYKREELLRRNALYDPLTGLPNRTLLMDRIEQAVQHLKRDNNYLFAVLFLDLDRFKLINDTQGHAMGDKVLIAIAKKLSQCVRSSDTVARLGGDEFILLLQDLKNKEEAIQIAERIMTSLNLPISIDEQQFFITASIGIAFSSRKIMDAREFLSNADLAMYDAKHIGKACYRIFDPALHWETTRKLSVEKLELEVGLSEALKYQQFVLHYQPIFSLITSNLVGFEALVRWQHPQRGLISPAKFIPIAEETGLIIPLSEWILTEACHQMKVWQEYFENAVSLRMSINVSGRQLKESNCVEKIDEILSATGLTGNSLKLEITESLLMENKESFGYFLRQMKQRGIQLSIDDFGTGYSSLSYLHRLPFDTVKIDRSFITNISVEEDSINIVQAIITLAHQLRINVIAEGIETEQQFRILQRLGCEFGQGYLFARPLDVQAAKGVIKERINSF